MVRALGLRCVVAVNRADLGDDGVRRYCAAQGLEIVLELPNDRRIAEAYARGELLLDAVEGLEGALSDAWERIVAAAQGDEVAS
jgi:MinD superfamily P-loop ATPase